MRVCVCDRERERVYARETGREVERERVCLRERERERESMCVWMVGGKPHTRQQATLRALARKLDETFIRHTQDSHSHILAIFSTKVVPCSARKSCRTIDDVPQSRRHCVRWRESWMRPRVSSSNSTRPSPTCPARYRYQQRHAVRAVAPSDSRGAPSGQVTYSPSE